MTVLENDRLIERFDPKVMSLLHTLDMKARYLVEGFFGRHAPQSISWHQRRIQRIP